MGVRRFRPATEGLFIKGLSVRWSWAAQSSLFRLLAVLRLPLRSPALKPVS